MNNLPTGEKICYPHNGAYIVPYVWRRSNRQTLTDVSEERTASIFILLLLLLLLLLLFV
jgi:hypothetical protein